ncbi:sulfatase/phosphatase domain-containing protein, partial [Photobacterium sp. OFAV2-7]|uniref:sulfatase/phosphatase domain-containing protein n=1 Tax=Photobacterium sp. OFAV2-7 TaxID=2917748 RepID=UPI001EF5486E
QGESLVPLLSGNSSENWRSSLYYHFYEYPAMHDVCRHYGMRDARYKLMHFYYQMDEWEFYDLQADPTEMNNAINDPAYVDVIQYLKEEIKQLEIKYDVPPMAEWVDIPLDYNPAPTLQELFPDSYHVTES